MCLGISNYFAFKLYQLSSSFEKRTFPKFRDRKHSYLTNFLYCGTKFYLETFPINNCENLPKKRISTFKWNFLLSEVTVIPSTLIKHYGEKSASVVC